MTPSGGEQPEPTATGTAQPPAIELQTPDNLQLAWQPDLPTRESFPDDELVELAVLPNDYDLGALSLVVSPAEELATRERVHDLTSGRLTLTPPELFRGANTLQLAIDDAEVPVGAPVSVFKSPPGHYRVDFGDRASYSTIYAYDDLAYDYERVWQVRMDRNEQAAYTGMISDLDKPGTNDDYTTKWVNAFYPEPMRGSETYNVWDRSQFRALTRAEDVLRAAGTATQIKQVLEGLRNRSRFANEFAATVERLINTVHSQEEEYTRKVTTAPMYQVGHGTCIAYAHLEETDLEGDHHWWFLNTTDYDVRPIKQQEGLIRNGYNPFVQSYHGGRSDSGELPPNAEKEDAVWGLLWFFHRGVGGWSYDEPIAVSDPLLEYVYNEHIRQQDGALAPILDMVARALDYQVQRGTSPLTIVGNRFDDTVYLTGPWVHNAAMEEMDTRLTKPRAYQIMTDDN